MTNSVMGMVRNFAAVTEQTPSARLYSDLIQEEYMEWYFASWAGPLDKEGDVEELKELSDLVYVIYGYANAMGWDLDEAIRRVHQNNLERVIQPDGTIKRREDGKILKRENPPKVFLEDLV
jgi:hypothetical protein